MLVFHFHSIPYQVRTKAALANLAEMLAWKPEKINSFFVSSDEDDVKKLRSLSRCGITHKYPIGSYPQVIKSTFLQF